MNTTGRITVDTSKAFAAIRRALSDIREIDLRFARWDDDGGAIRPDLTAVNRPANDR